MTPPPSTPSRPGPKRRAGTARYLGPGRAARLLGLSRDGFLKAGPPSPDATIDDLEGWSESTLRQWDETRPNRRRRLTPAQREAIRENLRAGLTGPAIAAQHGVSTSIVYQIKKTMQNEGDL